MIIVKIRIHILDQFKDLLIILENVLKIKKIVQKELKIHSMLNWKFISIVRIWCKQKSSLLNDQKKKKKSTKSSKSNLLSFIKNFDKNLLLFLDKLISINFLLYKWNRLNIYRMQKETYKLFKLFPIETKR